MSARLGALALAACVSTQTQSPARSQRTATFHAETRPVDHHGRPRQRQRHERAADRIGLRTKRHGDLRHRTVRRWAGSGRHAGETELDQLTQRTGGVAHYPQRVDDIHAVVNDLERHIRSQYMIAYAPSNQALDGSFRRVRVEVRGREPFVVRTREGYVAAPLVVK